MKWQQFLNIPNGHREYNHGADQCVALANLYHEQVIGGSFVPVASAYQWATQFDNFNTLTANYLKLSPGDNPKAGDIFVSRGGIYNSVDGHIGVVIEDWNGSTFGSKEQNAENNRYVWQTYRRTKSNMLAYLRPKKSPIGTTENERIETMYIRNSKTGQIALMGPAAGNGVYTFANIDEYNAWRSIVIASNSVTEERFQQQTPPEITNVNGFLNVDQTGWDVAVRVSKSG